jgi:tetratricopeptide (TPR) repeat protein
VREKSLGSGHPDLGQSLNNLATHYEKLGRHSDSEPLFKRALAIYEKAAGPEHPAVATLLNNLGQVGKVQRRYAEAEPLIRRSLAIREKVLGREHPDVARSLNNLADLYERQGRYAEAGPLFERALAIRERAVGPDHPDTATSTNNLAAFYQASGRPGDALPLVQRLIANGRAQPRAALPVLADAERQQLMPREKAVNDMLNVIQRGTQSSVASAVNKLAVRLAAGSDRLAELVRRDQDLATEAEALDKSIVAAVSKERSKRDAAAEQRARARLAAIATERASLQKTLSAEFPDYAALSNPLPLTVKEIQPLLSGDEAMVLFAVTEVESYVIAITRESFDWKPIPRGAETLSQKIAAFRRGLDLGKASDASGKSALFDLALAHELHETLLAPVDALIKDKPSLLVVASGALTALPFHLLVTEKPAAAIPEAFEGYRDAAWLLKRQAVSVLPSAASLKALRVFAARSEQSTKPMTGFGDPIFNPAVRPGDGNRPTRTAARSLAPGAYTDFWQGAGVDRTKLSPTDAISYDLYRRNAEFSVEGDQFPFELLQINQMGGVQQSVPQVITSTTFKTTKDYEDLIARLNGVPVLVEQTIALLQKGLDQKFTPPQVTMRDVPQQVLNLLVKDPAESSMLESFKEMPSLIPAGPWLARR